ncbi:hypothetical protein Dda_6150 [Drechslerella dactyloides]|uniref:HNH nuclease domain-containing protein n=1 Tax=Drechslerella dactyloides TaxID=74499 RepID=A0AAD6IVL6_DREDA|nr:hypothetical protein Dda_6150 [Drechslerella dactyloides]
MEWEDVLTPFRTERESHPIKFSRLIDYLDGLPYILPRDRLMIHAFLKYTTNEFFYDRFRLLSTAQLNDLAMISGIGLKNLRNWGGRPSSALSSPMASATGSPTGSPASSPRKGKAAMSPSLLTSVLAETAGQSSSEPELQKPTLGQDLLKIFGVAEIDPKLPTTGLARSPAAHIFPHSALDFSKYRNKITWTFLALFLGEQKRDILAKELHSESNGIHTCANGLALAPEVHIPYDQGYFSLVPFRRLAETPYFLDVQIHAFSTKESIGNVKIEHQADLDKQYTLDDGKPKMNDVSGAFLRAEHGFKLRLGTADPELYPLPSSTLLFWHHHLWRVLIAAGLGALREAEALAAKIDQPAIKKRKLGAQSGPYPPSPLSKNISGDAAYDGDWNESLDLDTDTGVGPLTVWVADEDVPFAPLEEL